MTNQATTTPNKPWSITTVTAALLIVLGTGLWFANLHKASNLDIRNAHIARAYGKTEEVNKLTSRALLHDPNNADATILRAESLVAENKHDEAIALLKANLPESSAPINTRRMLAACALDQITAQLELSVIDKNIDKLLALATEQANWLNQAKRDPVSASYIHGHCAWIKGVAAIRNAQTNTPGAFDTSVVSGYLYQAKAHFSVVIETHPTDVQTWQMHLSTLCSLNDWPGLKGALNTLSQQKNLPATLVYKAICAASLLPTHDSERTTIVKMLTASIRNEDRKEPIAIMATARSHIEQGRYNEAQTQLEALLHDKPRITEARYLLAHAFLGQKQYAQATRMIDSITSSTPASSQIQAMRYLCLMQSEQGEIAPQLLLTTISDANDTLTGINTLVRMLLETDQTQRAIELVEHLYETRHDDPRIISLVLLLIDSTAQSPRIVELTNRCLKDHPNHPALMTFKANILIALGQSNQAITLLNERLGSYPADIDALRCLVNAELATGNFAAAAATLKKMAGINNDTKAESTVSLARLYLMLGLREQARDTLISTRFTDLPVAPDVLLAFAQTCVILEENKLAEQCLAQIPRGSPTYPAARVLTAKLHLRQGNTAQAHEALDSLNDTNIDPNHLIAEVGHLAMNVQADRKLFEWLNEWIGIETLTPTTRAAWLDKHVLYSVTSDDPVNASESLDALAKLYPDIDRINAARILARLLTHRDEEARSLYLSTFGADQNDDYALLALALDLDTEAIYSDDPLTYYIAALIDPRMTVPANLAQRAPHLPTISMWDLKPLTNPAQNAEHIEASRRLGLAMIAMRAGLFAWGEQFATQAVDASTELTPAYAVCIEAIQQQGRDTSAMMKRIEQAIPDSSLTKYMKFQQLAANGQHDEAMRIMETLIGREPNNPHLVYRHAKLLENTGKTDLAIATYDTISQTPGPYQTAATNDHACLIATIDATSLSKAHATAYHALQSAPRNAAILDTVGWIEHLSGNNTKARKHLTQAIIASPDEPAIHRHLADVYLALGEPVWAFYHNKEADQLRQ